MALTPGTRLGPYEIVSALGAGGMGEVYRARDTRLNRLVALKILPASVAHDPERRERFAREAQAVAALNHPGIVTLYSVEDSPAGPGEAGGVTFITMELIEGRPLSSLIPADGLPLRRVLGVGASVLDAVAAAHQKGILHRDLKPANVMIGEGEHQGRVKILDFGLAKLTDAASSLSNQTTAMATGDGRILGTVSYMSPEQAEGKTVDARADVFSVGVMLYEMASGRRPFGGDTNIAILSAILKDTPASLTAISPSLPPDFDRIVRRALAKDPERRYQTAKDFRNDLEELNASIESGTAQPAPVTAAPAARRTPWLAIALVGLAAVGIGWWALTHSTSAPSARASSSAVTITPLTGTGTAMLPAMSPDGKYVVYVEAVGDEHSVWVHQIASGGTTRIIAPEKGMAIAGVTVTPDGSFVDVVRGGAPLELWRVPFLGGPARKIVDKVWTAPGWSADGKQMAYLAVPPDGKGQQLVVADANGGHVRAVATLTHYTYAIPYSTHPDTRPVWMPDGRSIAVIGSATSDTVHVTGVDLATGRESLLYTSTDSMGVTDWRMGFALGADGQSFILNLQPPARPAELIRVSLPGGEMTKLTNDLAMYFGASRAGDMVATSRYEQRTSLWVADAAGQGARQVGREMSATILKGIAWAGSRILFSASLAGSAGVWSMDTSSGASQFIVPAEAWSRISTTADGRTLYYARTNNSIWTSGTDGSHPARVIPEGTEPVVTPDGALLFIGAWNMVFDANGSPLRQLPVPSSTHDAMAVSRDGQFVTYQSGPEQVIVPVFGGPPVHRLPALPKQVGSVPHFTPDGKGLAYVDRTGLAIWVQPIAGGAPHQLVAVPDRPIVQFAWSPDGKQLAMSRAMTISDIVLLRGVR